MIRINRMRQRGQYSYWWLAVLFIVGDIVLVMLLKRGELLAHVITGTLLALTLRRIFWRSQFEAWAGWFREIWRYGVAGVLALAALAAAVLVWWKLPSFTAAGVFLLALFGGFFAGANSEGIEAGEWGRRRKKARMRKRAPASFRGLG